MNRLLIVTERFWPEDFIINDLAAELAKRGTKVSVFTQQPSYPRGRCPKGRRNAWFSTEEWNGVTIHRFKTVLGYRESLFYKLLNYLWFGLAGCAFALFRLPRFDKILVYQTGPLTQAVPAIFAARTRKKPLVIWTQDVWPDSVYAYGFRDKGLLPSFLNAFVRWVYGSSDQIMVSCTGFRRVLGKYTNKEMTYVPNWPLSRYVPGKAKERKDSKPVFLFAGNIGKVQNLENVIRGFALAFGRSPAFATLRIVGDGSHLDYLKELATTLGVPVEFPGRKAPEGMNGEYDGADYLVLSLANEPIFRLTVPSKFQMYLSVGKPILCAAAGEVSDMVKEGNLGLVTEPDDPEEIAEAFARMAGAGREEIAGWVLHAKETLETCFDRDKVIRTVESVIGIKHWLKPEEENI